MTMTSPVSVPALLLREALGEVLRDERIKRGLTLRTVSRRAAVSLGYLSELERGHKEVSSEMLACICNALDIPLFQVLLDAALKMRPMAEVTQIHRDMQNAA